MSGLPPPYAGLATRLNDTMSGSGAAPHAERLADGGISDSEAQMLAKRLTRRKQMIDLLEDEIDDLDTEAQRLGETLYDLKTHVQEARIDDAFRYPDTVRDLLEQADTLLEGRDVDGRSRAELEAEVERLRKERDNASEDLAHAYTLMKTAISQLSSARHLYEGEEGAPLRENAAINVEIRRLKAAHPEWGHIQNPADALDRAEDGQDE